MPGILNFLNNATVSAFAGALSAYFLVQFNDARRIRRKHTLIYQQMSGNSDLAKDKIKMIKKNLAMLENQKIDPAPLMKFSVEDVKMLKRDALDRLSTAEKRAIDSLCYTMQETDNLMDRATQKAEEIRLVMNDPSRIILADYIISEIGTLWTDALLNLRRFRNMSTWFLDKNYEKLLNARFVPEDYKTEYFD